MVQNTHGRKMRQSEESTPKGMQGLIAWLPIMVVVIALSTSSVLLGTEHRRGRLRGTGPERVRRWLWDNIIPSRVNKGRTGTSLCLGWRGVEIDDDVRLRWWCGGVRWCQDLFPFVIIIPGCQKIHAVTKDAINGVHDDVLDWGQRSRGGWVDG
jgi:hypothetical protein